MWFAAVLALGVQAYPFTITDDVYGPDPVVRLKVLVRVLVFKFLFSSYYYYYYLKVQSASLTLNDDIIRLQKNLQTGENMSVCYTSGGGVEELYLGSNLRKVSS